MPLFLQLLHTPSLRLDDGRLLPLPPNDAALLAVLAIDGPTSREAMAELLWPDALGEGRRTNLRQRLSRWKTRAGLVLQAGGSHTLALPVAPDGHTGDPAGTLSHDLQDLKERLQSDPAAGSGELLGSYTYDDNPRVAAWLQHARERWHASRIDAMAGIAERLEREHRIAEALVYASRIAHDNPLAEHAHRRVMRLHYLRGDRSAALAVYERLAQVLLDEFGEAPSSETRELAGTVARQTDAALPRKMQPVPAVLRRPPVLIGRDEVWQSLLQSFDRGMGVLLIGEPGIGKSRLLQDFSAAEPGVCLQCGRPGDSLAAYALAGRLLASLHERLGTPPVDATTLALLGRLHPPLGPATEGSLTLAALRAAMERALAAWHAAGLAGVIVDDIHFADDASLELLLPLAAAADAAALRWLFAVRPHQMPAPLVDLLENGIAIRLAPLRLEALNDADVTRLLSTLALPGLDPVAWAPRLMAHAGGNPLLLLATLAELSAVQVGSFDGPPPRLPPLRTLAAALRHRLHALTPAALQLAQVAAIAAQDFDVELAAAVMQCSVPTLVAPWRELEEAHVFGSGAFSHDLVREAVASEVPAVVARALCRQVAQWLAVTGAPPARVADHWWRSGSWPQAAAAFQQAAEDARGLCRQPEELLMLQRTAQAHDRAGQADAAFRCRWRAVHLTLATDKVAEALTNASALLDAATTLEQRQLALEARAAVHLDLTHSEQALDDVAAATRSDVTPSHLATSPLLQVRLARHAALALGRLNRHAEALQALTAVRQHALNLQDVDERLAWRDSLAVAYDYGDRPKDAVAVFQGLAEEAEATGRWTVVANALSGLGVALLSQGLTLRRLDAFERAVSVSQRHSGVAGHVLIDEMSLAGTLLDLGRFDAALTLGTRVADELHAAGSHTWAAIADNDLSCAYVWLGRLDLARQQLRPLDDSVPDWARGTRLMATLRIEQAQTLRPASPDTLADLRRWLGGHGRAYVRLRVKLELGQHTGDATATALIAADVEEEALRCEQFALAGRALTVQVEALRRAGQRDAAATAARRLLDRITRHQAYSVYPAEPWWRAAQAFTDAGDPASAGAALAGGIRWLQQDGLPHVPALFRDSFLNRNPINRELVAAARRQRHDAPD